MYTERVLVSLILNANKYKLHCKVHRDEWLSQERWRTKLLALLAENNKNKQMGDTGMLKSGQPTTARTKKRLLPVLQSFHAGAE